MGSPRAGCAPSQPGVSQPCSQDVFGSARAGQDSAVSILGVPLPSPPPVMIPRSGLGCPDPPPAGKGPWSHPSRRDAGQGGHSAPLLHFTTSSFCPGESQTRGGSSSPSLWGQGCPATTSPPRCSQELGDKPLPAVPSLPGSSSHNCGINWIWQSQLLHPLPESDLCVGTVGSCPRDPHPDDSDAPPGAHPPQLGHSSPMAANSPLIKAPTSNCWAASG